MTDLEKLVLFLSTDLELKGWRGKDGVVENFRLLAGFVNGEEWAVEAAAELLDPPDPMGDMVGRNE